MNLSMGERIKLRRLELNISQQELATAIGKSHQTSISKIELGQRGVPLRYVRPLAEKLKTTPEYLLGETDDPDEVLVPKFVTQNGDSKVAEINAFAVLLTEEYRDQALSFMRYLYQEQTRYTHDEN